MSSLNSDKAKIYSIAVNGRCLSVIESVCGSVYRVLQAATDEAARSFALKRGDIDEALASTLMPLVGEFHKYMERDSVDDSNAFPIFRRMSAKWQFYQMRSAAVAIILAELALFDEYLSTSVFGQGVEKRIAEIRQLRQDIEGRPEAARASQMLEAQEQQLLDLVVSRATVSDPGRARVLSSLVQRLTTEPVDTPSKASTLAALVTLGKKSQALEQTCTAVQVLSTDETAMLFRIQKRQLVDRISRVRNQSMEDETIRIHPGRPLTRPEDLWVHTPLGDLISDLDYQADERQSSGGGAKK